MTKEKYIASFDEINRLARESLKKNKKNADMVVDDMETYLINAYLDGMETAKDMIRKLDEEDEFDMWVDIFDDDWVVSRLHEAIYKDIAGKTFADRVREHVANEDESALARLAETEYHRIFNTAETDVAGAVPIGMNKTWETMMDDRVRDTHEYLQSVTVPVEERFYTYDGDSAMYPGDFGNVENNVNCRCWLTFSRR